MSVALGWADARVREGSCGWAQGKGRWPVLAWRETDRGENAGPRFAGLVKRKRWAAEEFGLGWVFSYVFSISNQTNLGEIKFKFEFTTSTQTTKAMHQHECINKVLTLDKILITYGTKIRLNARLDI